MMEPVTLATGGPGSSPPMAGPHDTMDWLVATRILRVFLLVEAASFIGAALVHFGVLLSGYEHRTAGNAESVIGLALLLSWGWTLIWPRSTGRAGLWVQSFALIGTLMGVLTIVVGVGPRSAGDVGYHVTIVVVLVWGLWVAARAQAAEASQRL